MGVVGRDSANGREQASIGLSMYTAYRGPMDPGAPVTRDLFTEDLEHACAALRAHAFHRLAAIGHCNLLGVLHFTLGFALHTIGFSGHGHLFWSGRPECSSER